MCVTWRTLSLSEEFMMMSGRQPGIAAHRLSGHHREGAALGRHTSSSITRMNVGCGVLFKLGFLGPPHQGQNKLLFPPRLFTGCALRWALSPLSRFVDESVCSWGNAFKSTPHPAQTAPEWYCERLGTAFQVLRYGWDPRGALSPHFCPISSWFTVLFIATGITELPFTA